jgi:hypothetical protein
MRKHPRKEQELDGTNFDELTRLFTTRTRRRGLLTGVGGAALATALGLGALGPEEAAAKKKKKKKKGKGGSGGGTCRGFGQSCSSGGECCSNTCDIGKGGSLVCCTFGQIPEEDDPCSSDADCCGGGFCTSGSRCVFP